MTVEFEIDRTKSAKEKAGTQADVVTSDAPINGGEGNTDTTPVEDLVETPKVDAKAEKAKLQAILDEAGVEYSKQLGVAKLQKLVDELPEAE